MPKKHTKVTPSGGYATYQDDRLGIPEFDVDKFLDEEGFKSASSIQEGTAGRARIDSTFENYSEDVVNRPRSGDDIPLPVDRFKYPHRVY